MLNEDEMVVGLSDLWVSGRREGGTLSVSWMAWMDEQALQESDSMRTRRRLRQTFFFPLASLLVGCSGPTEPVPGSDLQGTFWNLVSVDISSGSLVPSGAPPTLTFTTEGADRSGWLVFRVYGGCNQGGGIYRTKDEPLDDRPLEIDGFAATEMACLGGGVMELEAAYFAVLTAATSFAVVSFESFSTGGEIRLVIRAPGAALQFVPEGRLDSSVLR